MKSRSWSGSVTFSEPGCCSITLSKCVKRHFEISTVVSRRFSR